MPDTKGGNRIIVTEDGSHSLFNEKLNETYHSFHGAIQESKYVFIEAGLDYFSSQKKELIRVFEVGFGTGLNVLLTSLWAKELQITVIIDSIEAYPIEDSLKSELNYPQLIDHENAVSFFDNIHSAPWNEEIVIHSHMNLKKIKATLEDFENKTNYYDIIYYDAFAPSKQPEMWEMNMLEPIVNSLNPGGIFVTYCAQGQLKRNLKSLGLEVETLPGPPGKKEMVRGLKAV